MADRLPRTGERGTVPRQGSADPRWGLDATAVLLLVEDDAGDALLVREVLVDSGLPMEATWCKSLAEARVFLDATPYSVCVLLDLHLPDTHGLSAVRLVRDAAPDAAVVVLTGVAENEAGLALAGADEHRNAVHLRQRDVRSQRHHVRRAVLTVDENEVEPCDRQHFDDLLTGHSYEGSDELLSGLQPRLDRSRGRRATVH